MLVDLGSRDQKMIDVIQEIRDGATRVPFSHTPARRAVARFTAGQ